VINEGTDEEEVLPAKGMRQLKKGDTYTVYSSGGGGWGTPLERDPAAVLDDVRNGYVSLQAAKEIYGVIIRDGKVDEEATEELRRETSNVYTESDFNITGWSATGRTIPG
jgi:N-methylhydantoinase B